MNKNMNTCAVIDPCLEERASLVTALAQRGLDIIGLFTPHGDSPNDKVNSRLLSTQSRLSRDHIDAVVDPAVVEADHRQIRELERDGAYRALVRTS